jgi:hypothetical protein
VVYVCLRSRLNLRWIILWWTSNWFYKKNDLFHFDNFRITISGYAGLFNIQKNTVNSLQGPRKFRSSNKTLKAQASPEIEIKAEKLQQVPKFRNYLLRGRKFFEKRLKLWKIAKSPSTSHDWYGLYMISTMSSMISIMSCAGAF